MQLPEIKEREYRFKLALRMGIPVFALLILHTFINTPKILDINFYTDSIFILLISIYFIFYLIYKSYDNKITDDVSKVFTRDALYKHINKDLKSKNEYTFLLISIDNLNDINTRYGVKSADKVLYEFAIWVCEYLENKNLKKFPIGHINHADFIIELKGINEQYKSILEMICLGSYEYKIDNIELQISAAINDTRHTRDLNYIIEDLIELQNENRNTKLIQNSQNDIQPNELETYVVNSIKEKKLLILLQDIYFKNSKLIKENFVKLESPDGKIIHTKKYIKVLDKFRLMSDFDMLVLEQNILNCKSDAHSLFAINISPTSIRNTGFIKKVTELFENNKEIQNRIIFILYEKEYYPHIEKYNSILQTLRELGILIAIDKLGSSQTSFLYLRELDIDIIRFDSFYSKNIFNKKNKSIISALNLMAKSNKIKTWVKMVETKESFLYAQELDIDYIQGIYLSKLEK